MKKRIVLCADDFGQALPISDGILDLVKNQRLSAVSCLVNEADWPSAAAKLLPFRSQIDVGLHFNLTQGRALSKEFQSLYGPIFKPLPILLLHSCLRRLDLHVVKAECQAQLDAFVDATGFLPNYLDGHQHVHQLPVVRDAVVAVYLDCLRSTDAYLRLSNESTPSKHLSTALKKQFIRMLGVTTKKRYLHNKVPHNQSFGGSYPFNDAAHYRDYFLHFLRHVQANGIIMCHPGLKQATGTGDAIAKARYLEYEYLGSEQFLKDCEDFNVAPARFERGLLLL